MMMKNIEYTGKHILSIIQYILSSDVPTTDKTSESNKRTVFHVLLFTTSPLKQKGYLLTFPDVAFIWFEFNYSAYNHEAAGHSYIGPRESHGHASS